MNRPNNRVRLGVLVGTSLLVAILALVAQQSPANASPIGPSSTSFTCTTHDDNWGDNVCFCEGGSSSLDCLAMKSQCDGTVSCDGSGACACDWDMSMMSPDMTAPRTSTTTTSSALVLDFDPDDLFFGAFVVPTYYGSFGTFATLLY